MTSEILKLTTLVAGLASIGASAAKADATIETASFTGATNLQSWVAQDKGFYAREGLTVNMNRAEGSAKEAQALFAGKFQIMSSAFDNTVAYMNGQGDVSLPDASDLVVIMGVHSGLNALVSAPADKTFDSLKGKTAAVDAKKSGYAFVLYALMAKRGVHLGRDFDTVAVGGTPNRMKAIDDGQAAFTMISGEEEGTAKAKGYNVLADSRELGPYQGSVYVTRRSWAKAHPAELAGYIRATVAATDFIFSNKAETIAILRKHELKLTDESADKLYMTLIGPFGFDPHAKVNMAGVDTVVRVREDFAEPKKKLAPATTYVDQSYYDNAVAKK